MSNILVIEPSSSGLELLVTAKSMGLKNFVFNANQDERIIPNSYLNYIDTLIKVDTYNISAMYQLANLINQKDLISAIIPGSEYHVPVTAQLSSLMNLPGVSPKYVDGLRLKNIMRGTLNINRVRCPRYAVISNESELLDAAKYVKFPCVLKPACSAGSIHVTRADNISDLYNLYKVMCSDTWTELGKGIGTVALLEEYISGDEFSIEGYIQDNNVSIISITKKFLTPEPLFIEMGHIVPALISNDLSSKISFYINDVVKALNINLGIFHAEIKIDDNGPVLMEIAGRLPGCRIPDLIRLAYGINLYEIMIQSHLGLRIKINKTPHHLYAGMRYFELKGKDQFSIINGLENLSNMEGFYEFKLLKKAGEIIPPLTSFLGRTAMCIFTAPSYEELKSRLEIAESVISFS